MRPLFTALRKSILTLIEQTPVPLTVYQIRDGLPEKCDLSNLYRGLRFLERERLVESFSFSCEKEGNARFYFGAGDRHAHFIHCEKCHRFTRIRDCFLGGRMKTLERRYAHTISRHFLLFTGTCAKCTRRYVKA